MTGEIKKIHVGELVNYYENPRHAIGSTEEDTLKKLFDAVGYQYMLNLAEDIQKNGLLGNQQIVVVYSETIQKYIVYEGNRRVAAIKLLHAPDKFKFLDKATIERAKRIGAQGNIPDVITCYITSEQEAFFIMERTHSGEDRGRGVKQWTSKEKEAFKVRQNKKGNISYLIDFYIKKYFNGFEITKILPFTTIQRIFNNREVKKQIGLDSSDESSFTVDKMRLVIDASNWIKEEAEIAGIVVTRLFNKSEVIEEKIVPWIREYMQGKPWNTGNVNKTKDPKEEEKKNSNLDLNGDINNSKAKKKNSDDDRSLNNDDEEQKEDRTGRKKEERGSGGKENLPYFFQGLKFGHLDPNDVNSHGVAAICKELKYFSDRSRRLVEECPISAVYLIRAIIEQSLIYYSKTHYIQGQKKLIWEDIKNIRNLKGKIDCFNKNLSNYITDTVQRQYFGNFFSKYEKYIEPINWVIHRTTDYKIDPHTLIELPRSGLLALINFLISESDGKNNV